MNKIEYTLAFGVAYLTAATLAGGDTLTVRVNADDATLTFGNLRTKIKDGEGRVEFSALNDGRYDAMIITKDEATKLGTFKIRHGVLSISRYESVLAALSRDVLSIKRAQECTSGDIAALQDAVFGKKIF